MKTKVEILTGIRPTNDLTVANYLGAIEPIIKLQRQKCAPLIFIADLHALTDNEPIVVKKYTNEIITDCIALGINPKKTKIFLQSAIAGETSLLTALLARHVSVAELLRVPTLKEKIKANANPETANVFLFLYPVMMAADILLQRARKIPLGEDQLAHLELSRELARRFNKRYGEVFPIPEALQTKALRILSLKGEGKMSKNMPEGAIFLTDDLKTVARKIKGAETAVEGVMNEKLESHILIAKSLSKTKAEQKEIDALIAEHKAGKPVLVQFKHVFIRIVQKFLVEFQSKRAKVVRDSFFIPSILEEGIKIARANAQETLELINQALYHS